MINNTTSTTNQSDRHVKLKELLDSGVITQEEFDEKKNQILNEEGLNQPPESNNKWQKKLPPKKLLLAGALLIIAFLAVVILKPFSPKTISLDQNWWPLTNEEIIAKLSSEGDKLGFKHTISAGEPNIAPSITFDDDPFLGLDNKNLDVKLVAFYDFDAIRGKIVIGDLSSIDIWFLDSETSEDYKFSEEDFIKAAEKLESLYGKTTSFEHNSIIVYSWELPNAVMYLNYYSDGMKYDAGKMYINIFPN